MRRLLPHPILSLMLVVIWLLLANQMSPGQVLLGALLGWMIPLYTARFWPDEVNIRRPLVLLRFLGVLLYDILVANFSVARLILGHADRIEPAFIEMRLELRTEVAISLLANTISLTPGTVSTFLSADHRTLVIHGLHTKDPAAVIDAIRKRYEQPIKEVFESC